MTTLLEGVIFTLFCYIVGYGIGLLFIQFVRIMISLAADALTHAADIWNRK